MTMLLQGAGLQTAGSTLLNGLVSGYKFEGGVTDVMAANNGTNSGLTFSLADGKILQGAASPAGQYMEIGTLSSWRFIQNTMNFTVAIWVKTLNFAGTVYMFGNTGTSAEKGFFMTNSLSAVCNGTGAVVASVATPGLFGDASYTHLILRGSGNGLQVYKNGVVFAQVVGIGALSAGDSTRLLHIGEITAQPPNPINGAFDELYIWNRAITAAEIATLYNGGAGKTYPFT
jgi:hypothetical protein